MEEQIFIIYNNEKNIMYLENEEVDDEEAFWKKLTELFPNRPENCELYRTNGFPQDVRKLRVFLSHARGVIPLLHVKEKKIIVDFSDPEVKIFFIVFNKVIARFTQCIVSYYYGIV